MSKSGRQGRTKQAKRHTTFRLTPIAAACSALLFASGGAFAQQPVPEKPVVAGEDAKAKAEADAKAEAAKKEEEA